MPKTIHAIISGRVQGVSYRAWTVQTASILRLDGWVRNRSDGTVEAVFSGEEETVMKMLEACHIGPSAARVTNIKTDEIQEMPEKGFRHLPTL
jgi:acylphosphatase